MSKNRKRSGTQTAAQSPPSKRHRQTKKDKDKSRQKEDNTSKGPAASKPPGKKNKVTVEEVALDKDGLEIVDDPGKAASAKDGGDQRRKPSTKVEEMGSEEELAEMSQHWNSALYAFFETDARIEYVNGRRTHFFKCLARPCKHKEGGVRRFLDKGDRSSTSGLQRHAKKCFGEEAVAAAMAIGTVAGTREDVVKPVLQSAAGSTITVHFQRKKGQITYSHRNHTRMETRTEIVKWVSESLRPFKIVKDRGFLVLMKTGRPGYHVPSPSTVSRDVKTVFARTRSRIAKLLREYEGRLHFGTDAWTSPNHRAFVAITVHFEHRGEPICLVLDVVEVAESHTGVHLAEVFAEILQEFGIEEKIMALVCDNASNNDKMIEELAEPELLGDAFDGHKARVRCFLHVMALVAKSLIKQFDADGDKAKDEGDWDGKQLEKLTKELREYEKQQRDASTRGAGASKGKGKGKPSIEIEVEDESDEDGDDEEDEVDALEELSLADRETIKAGMRPIRLVIAKLRAIASKVIHSTTKLQAAWKRACEAAELTVKFVLRDVRTRWNSTFDMLQSAIEYRVVVETITAQAENNLRDYELTKAEWDIATQLAKVLKIFKDATLFFSRGTPSLAQVIPAMDQLDKHLTTASGSPKYLPAIRVAAKLSKIVLNKYYSLSDASKLYRLAVILHPAFKLQYFKRLKWPDAWQRMARKLLEDEYRDHYADLDVQAEEEVIEIPPATPTASSRSASRASSLSHSSLAGEDEHRGEEDEEEESSEDEDKDKDDDESSEGQGTSSRRRRDDSEDELDFMQAVKSWSKPEFDPVTDELESYLGTPVEEVADPLVWWFENRHKYPRLSRMARDYLSIPATSIDVERLWSRGRLVLPHVRNRLSAQSTRAILCLGNWSTAGFVRPEDAKKVAALDELEDDSESDFEMEDGWDSIDITIQ